MKKCIVWIVLQFLYRGIRVLYHDDIRVKKELDGWNKNQVITLKIHHGPSITMQYTYLHGIRKVPQQKADITITFKSIHTAIYVFLGMMSVKQAYLEHRFILQGDIYESMRFVRCVDLVETYLFPRMMTRRILECSYPKYHSSLLIYLKTLFCF